MQQRPGDRGKEPPQRPHPQTTTSPKADNPAEEDATRPGRGRHLTPGDPIPHTTEPARPAVPRHAPSPQNEALLARRSSPLLNIFVIIVIVTGLTGALIGWLGPP